MNQIYLIFCLLFIYSASGAQDDNEVLFSVNNRDVLASEFRYVYEKNNGAEADYSRQSVEEYLELYIKFKLKVEKAKALQIDTITELKKELAGYRKQLAKAYLVDKEVTNKLVDEAYERKLQDVHLRHILVGLSPNASKEEEGQKMEKIYLIKEKLDNGADFGLMAKTLSDDKRSASSQGNLGWITAMLPSGFYDLESAAYNLPIGKLSQPIRSRMGLHLIEVMDRRPARGEMEVSHILVRKTIDNKPIKNAKAKIDSLYQSLLAGSSFERMAREYSDDKSTSQNGGNLGFFTIGMYDINFENAAFGLQADGDISEPIESKIGWHIIQRKQKNDYSNDVKTKNSLKNEVSKNDRFEIAKREKINSIKKDASYQENIDLLYSFISNQDSTFYSYQWEPSGVDESKLASFKDFKDITISNFAEHCKSNNRQRLRFDRSRPLNSSIMEMYNSYIDEKAIEYEESNLENKYPDFKSLMREYSEGILLFEVTKENVWDKASSDTLGLRRYFENNRSKYQWKDRAEIIEYIVETTDKSVLTALNSLLKNSSTEEIVKGIKERTGQTVYVEERIYEKDDDKLRNLKWKSGTTDLVIDQVNKETVGRKIINILQAGPKSLKEARGYIIADYQDVLEKEWVEDLRNEFDVQLNQDVLSGMIR